MRRVPVWQFATERRRGWVESPDSPERHPDDPWDERRNARMQKRQPSGERVLHVESVGRAGGEFGTDLAVDGLRVRYALEGDGDIEPQDDLQWADWDAQGRLLVATRTGLLQVRRLLSHGHSCDFEADLTRFEPDPQPAPDWAARW